MSKPSGTTPGANGPKRVLASIKQGWCSTWNAYTRRRLLVVTVGRLEPSKEDLSKLNLSGPRTMCDHCNAAHARYIVSWGDGKYELHLCGHHWHKHKFSLGTRAPIVTELPDES